MREYPGKEKKTPFAYKFVWISLQSLGLSWKNLGHSAEFNGNSSSQLLKILRS
jgi:hypothetical protein